MGFNPKVIRINGNIISRSEDVLLAATISSYLKHTIAAFTGNVELWFMEVFYADVSGNFFPGFEC